jgi:hypothetical protein
MLATLGRLLLREDRDFHTVWVECDVFRRL